LVLPHGNDNIPDQNYVCDECGCSARPSGISAEDCAGGDEIGGEGEGDHENGGGEEFEEGGAALGREFCQGGLLGLGAVGAKGDSVGREICVLDEVGNRKGSIYVGTAGEMSEVLAGGAGEIILSALSSAMVRRVAIMVVDADGSELSRRGRYFVVVGDGVEWWTVRMNDERCRVFRFHLLRLHVFPEVVTIVYE